MKKYGKNKFGFTLIELLVVISIIALLLSILMPSLSRARSHAKSIVGKSNIRQLNLANQGYSTENNGHFVLAAKDFYSDSTGGLHRWHGVRETSDLPFDSAKGPLAPYLADGKVKKCPERTDFQKNRDWNSNFEKGCGGYGYNQMYIGSRSWESISAKNSSENSTKVTEVKRPAETLMFADCAMAKKNQQHKPYLIEYSFAEPPFWLNNCKPMKTWGYASPSIHFRHSGKANIVYVDGHVDSRQRTNFNLRNGYGVKSSEFNLGWFAPLDNSIFDLE